MILINGESTGHICALDRGLLYGDGLFETIAWRHGRLVLWERHMARLALGCTRLNLACPEVTLLEREALQVAAGEESAVIKLIITRGVGGRGYSPTSTSITRVVIRHPWPHYPSTWAQDGIRVRLCGTRLARQPQLAGIKHLNRLEQVLARGEWNPQDEDFAEGLMLDDTDAVICGTQSNLFVVQDGTVYTPDLQHCGVAGTLRAWLLDEAPRMSGRPPSVAPLTLAQLHQADEIFVGNSITGLWPVRELAGRTQPPPGPMVRKFQATLRTKEGLG